MSNQNMKNTDKILIKDPYLNSTFKPDQTHHLSSMSALNAHNINPDASLPDHSKWRIQQDLKRELERTQNQFRRMARAYTEENKLNKKILDFQAVNGEYHESLKLRNLDLNNRLNDMVTHTHVLNTKFESDCVRNYHEKDLMIRKFEAQAQELLQARKTINNLLQNKSKLQEELQHIAFVLEKESDRFALEIKEQMLRMEGLERTIKNVTELKDQEISQLRNRIRIYEDENKRLNDENRGLNITLGSQKERERGLDREKERDREKENRAGIENLSQIQHLDSHGKDQSIQKQLQDQHNINQKLQRQVEELKKKLFSTHENQKKTIKHDQSPQKINGIVSSLNTIRNGINNQVFDVFYKSVKDGEKHRSNSLVIFIENWKHIDLYRIAPYIQSYFESRDNLKQIYESNKYQGKPIQQQMQECIPLHISLRKGRSEINSWILSTIQHTKNQRESSKKTINNLLLFLFRLLTINYRITYPMQGKSYTIDTDVKNQLAHQIVKAVNYIIQFY